MSSPHYVQSIESHGTEWIDLGFKATQNTRIVCAVEGYSISENPTTSLYGARTSTSATDQFSFNIAGSANYRADYYNSRVLFPSNLSYSGSITIDQSKNVCTITPEGGTQVSVTNISGSFTGSYNVCLFCENRGGNKQYFAKYKLFFIDHFEGDLLVNSWKPVLDVNGVPCLYDDVGGAYYYNQGSGTFGYTEFPYPDTPTATASEINKTSARLSWNAVECNGYNVYLNGSFVESTTSLNYVFSGLTKDTQYTLSVSAFNDFGESEKSIVSIRTLPSTEPPAPTILILSDIDSVVLSFHSSDATSYSLWRNGIEVYNGSSEVYIDDYVSAFESYVYSCFASNSDGTSPKSSVSVSVSTENPLIYLVTDRTQEDVDAVMNALVHGMPSEGMKGAYNAKDMNRVETATEFVRNYLLFVNAEIEMALSENTVAPDSSFVSGIDVPQMQFKKDWSTSDIVSPSDASRYLENVRAITMQVPIASRLPSTIDKLNFVGANEIEKALIDEHEAAESYMNITISKIGRTADAFIYSAEFSSGEDLF